MNRRQLIHVDAKTGDVVRTETTVTSDKPFAERVRDATAQGLDRLAGDVDEQRGRLLCDRCDAVVDVDLEDPRLPEGWTETPDGDFCPACSSTQGETAP